MTFRRLVLQLLLIPICPVFMKGPSPDDLNKPTPEEIAQTEVATRMFNLALEGKPVTDAYAADISRNPSETANVVQGQAAVDIAKQTPATFDPNRGMNVAGADMVAGKRAKIMSDIGNDSVGQKAAGMKSLVENAMGKQSTANTAMAGMAQDAVSRNLSNAQSEYTSNAAGMSALSSLAGAGAGAGMSLMKEKK